VESHCDVGYGLRLLDPVCPSVCRFFIPFLRISVRLSVRLSARLFVCLSVLLPTRLSVRPSVCLLFALPQILPCDIPSRNPHPGHPNTVVGYSGLSFSPQCISRIFPWFWKKLSMKSNKYDIFSIWFSHRSTALWSRPLLYDHETSEFSFAPCFKSLTIHCFRH